MNRCQGRGAPLYVSLESSVGIRQLFQFRQLGTVALHGDGSDLLFGQGTVLIVGLGGSDGIHNLHTGGDLAESGVLLVQVLGILVHQEELGTGGVGGGGAGHAEDTALVLDVILGEAVEQELALDAVAGAAHAGALGTAALDHEAGDDPVEDQAVVVALLTQGNEVCNALRCLVGIQLAFDDTAVFHGDLKSRICHIVSPFCRYTQAMLQNLHQRQMEMWHVPRLPLVGERHA